ncbi:unnamed protein product, partial [Arabidopsis halleri]
MEVIVGYMLGRVCSMFALESLAFFPLVVFHVIYFLRFSVSSPFSVLVSGGFYVPAD